MSKDAAYPTPLDNIRAEVPEAFLKTHDGYVYRAVRAMAERIAELEAKLARHEDERVPLHADDVWQMKLDAAERDRESILRRYKVIQARLVKARAWLEESNPGADALMSDSAPNYAQLADILDGREDP